ncbi:hypothetical protein [Arthrobacter woluwensis]|uniref:hypothetical protein n=1 Tax=Arthrobacter woluwensis TaxID=156980 RepID=UPI0037FBFE10
MQFIDQFEKVSDIGVVEPINKEHPSAEAVQRGADDQTPTRKRGELPMRHHDGTPLPNLHADYAQLS